jgi:hypothetical protein
VQILAPAGQFSEAICLPLYRALGNGHATGRAKDFGDIGRFEFNRGLMFF